MWLAGESIPGKRPRGESVVVLFKELQGQWASVVKQSLGGEGQKETDGGYVL